MANLTNSNKLIEKIDNLNVVRVSNTAPSNPTLGMAWYDSTSSSKMLKIYNGTSWDIVGPEMIPITQDAYDALSPAEKNNGKYYLITDAEGTIIVNWEDIVGAPTIPENTSDLNNDSGFITGINSSDVTTALGFTPYNASNPSGYQTASQVSSAINTALGSVYRYKGSKTTYSQLPTSGQITGDVWNIEQADSEHGIKAGDNVAWNGSAWDVLSGTVDLTSYFNKTTDNSDSITQGSNNLFLTGAERTKLSNLSGTNTGDETTATIKTKLGAASASQDGYLKKEDFATFNGKQDVLTAGDGISIENGVISSTSTGGNYIAGEGIYIGDITFYDDYSAMRGPCDDGFHIPLKTELEALVDAGINMGAWTSSNGQNLSTYLKLPYSGRFSNADADGLKSKGSIGYCASATYVYWLSFSGSNVSVSSQREVDAVPIRPFKDEPVIPDSNWTTLYSGSGDSGIFYNSTLGLISISNGASGWITIADKNLGATIVYNYGDTLSDSNTGKYFQWGNCEGYQSSPYRVSNGTVDVTGYGPGNYYYGDGIYMKYAGSGRTVWTSSRNYNLWGGETGIQATTKSGISNTGVLSINGQTGNVNIDDTVYTEGEGIKFKETYYDYSAMRGPCPKGFHIPLGNEGKSLCSIIQNLGLTWNSTNIGIYLKLADKGFISNTGSKDIYNTRCCWTAECSTNTATCIMPTIDSSGSNVMGVSGSCAIPIRPFKDEPVIPDNTWTTLYTSDVSPTSRNIKHSQSLGLITISYDGTYITIADKNIGATVVYNNGDTYNQNNIGYCYQRGNNYGFEFATVQSSSSEKVDVSSYSPGEYNSNIFVTADIGSSRWISSNGDLRGGETGIVIYNNAITNTGVLSVNGQTGDVTIDASEASSITTTQPSSPVEGDVYYDTTNDVVKVYDGTNWNVIGDDAADINTKTFYLSSPSDLTNAQAAYDWYAAGKNPIIIYNNKTYLLYEKTSSYIKFVSTEPGTSDVSDGTSYEYLYGRKFNLNSSTVTSIVTSNVRLTSYHLRTGFNYPTPYTPQYNGSPATKKYVDDNVSVISGDSGVTYTIKVSNSTPASGTANNIITLVIPQ